MNSNHDWQNTLENRGLAVLSLVIGGLIVLNLGRNIAELNASNSLGNGLRANEVQLD
jgi:hypothetical protein